MAEPQHNKSFTRADPANRLGGRANVKIVKLFPCTAIGVMLKTNRLGGGGTWPGCPRLDPSPVVYDYDVNAITVS